MTIKRRFGIMENVFKIVYDEIRNHARGFGFAKRPPGRTEMLDDSISIV